MPFVGTEIISVKPERCNWLELQDSPMPILINLVSGSLEVKHDKKTTQMRHETPMAFTGRVSIHNDMTEDMDKDQGEPQETEVQYIYLHKGSLVKWKYIGVLEKPETNSLD